MNLTSGFAAIPTGPRAACAHSYSHLATRNHYLFSQFEWLQRIREPNKCLWEISFNAVYLKKKNPDIFIETVSQKYKH